MSSYLANLKKKAVGQLDAYLQKNVDNAYNLGETAGDVAAAGAALGSSAAEFLLPESEMDLVPVGKVAGKMKKVMPDKVRDALIQDMRAKGIPQQEQVEKLRKLNEGDLWQRVLNKEKSTEATKAMEEGSDKLRNLIQKEKQLEAFGAKREVKGLESAQPAKFRETAAKSVQQLKQDAGSAASAYAKQKKKEEDELANRLTDY